MATDYAQLAKDTNSIVDALGVKKAEVQQLFDVGGNNAAVTTALAEVDKLTAALAKMVNQNDITEEERKRKLADLDGEIKLLQITKATDPDFTERIEAERELSLMLATKAAWLEAKVLNFGDLINADGNSLRMLLQQAGKEIAARQDLARVLKGIEIVLRVGAFSGAVAAKLAIAAAA